MKQPLSVIIPLAPGEEAWRELVPQLDLPEDSEIILACGKQHCDAEESPVKIVQSEPGRAQQMNAGARSAQNSVLWFLHADSRLSADALPKLFRALAHNPDCLWFFDLKFADDGPSAMRINEQAVRWRAGSLKMPFGDQGFSLSRELFFELGCYREDLAYGEDHVFVWKVRQEGYPVERVGAELFTSARKYAENGWASTTLDFVIKTIQQAAPQFVTLLYRRMERLFS